VNLQGMRGPQRFSIHRAYTDIANLPTAHTCFNQVIPPLLCSLLAISPLLLAQLDLPEYKSEQDLREKLLTAIKEGSEGFGFA
jgi:E3 ubiquitin-protein ligase HUWE1